jgi:hypothetical protein
MSEQLEVLKIVTQRLNKTEIPYMISGSTAANYYTVPRMTRDIDIVIELKDTDIDKFVDLFESDFYIDKETIKNEVMRKGIFNLIHNQYVIKIDFIIHKESDFHKIAFSRRKNIFIENSPMWFISAEDLILAKLVWAKDSRSEIQIKDMRNLLKTVEYLDMKYIKEWVIKLSVKEIYQEVKNE